MDNGKTEYWGNSYSYDAAGNTTHDAGTGLNYTYDPESRMVTTASFAGNQCALLEKKLLQAVTTFRFVGYTHDEVGRMIGEICFNN